MWAELETGSSSAGPWTIPSADRAAGRKPSLGRFAQAPWVPAGSGGAAGSPSPSSDPPPRRRLTNQ